MITLDLNIWWSVPQFVPRIILLLQMTILSQHLVLMKFIICPCRERGCVQVVLCASFCLLNGVCHCWSICTDYCRIPVLSHRDYHSHYHVTHWMGHFCQLCHDVPLIAKPTPVSLLSPFNCHLMAFSSHLTFHCRVKMESNRAGLGIPGCHSGMSISIVVHEYCK